MVAYARRFKGFARVSYIVRKPRRSKIGVGIERLRSLCRSLNAVLSCPSKLAISTRFLPSSCAFETQLWICKSDGNDFNPPRPADRTSAIRHSNIRAVNSGNFKTIVLPETTGASHSIYDSLFLEYVTVLITIVNYRVSASTSTSER